MFINILPTQRTCLQLPITRLCVLEVVPLRGNLATAQKIADVSPRALESSEEYISPARVKSKIIYSTSTRKSTFL